MICLLAEKKGITRLRVFPLKIRIIAVGDAYKASKNRLIEKIKVKYDDTQKLISILLNRVRKTSDLRQYNTEVLDALEIGTRLRKATLA